MSDSMEHLAKGRYPRWAGPMTLYLALTAGLFGLYRYVDGPDALSYVVIAQHYAAGRWAEAINTNWSPMFSWLLTPFLLAGMEGLLAARILGVLSGVAALAAVWRLAELFGLAPRTEKLLLYVAAVMIASYALLRTGPDLLLAAILLLYFRVVFAPDYGQRRRAGAACGLLGAAAFLTKGYAFYFFLGHFFLMNAWHLVRAAVRTQVLRHWAAGVGVFLLLGGPWVWLMSRETGRLAPGTTGDWNYRLVGPESPGYPQYGRLLPPASPHGISMWEEPAPSLLPAWSPWSGSGLRHQLRLIWVNVRAWLEYILYGSLFSVSIVFGYLLWGLSDRDEGSPHWILPIVTVLFYPMGYFLVLVQERYLWPTTLLILVLGAFLVDRLLENRFLSPIAGWVLMAGLALSFVVLPVRMLAAQRNSGKALYELSRQIRERAHPKGRLAACGRWNDSLAIAYFLGMPFFGTTDTTPEEDLVAPELNPSFVARPRDAAAQTEKAAQDLAQYRIDYYLVWDNCRSIPAAVTAGEEVTGGRLRGLKLYRLRHP